MHLHIKRESDANFLILEAHMSFFSKLFGKKEKKKTEETKKVTPINAAVEEKSASVAVQKLDATAEKKPAAKAAPKVDKTPQKKAAAKTATKTDAAGEKKAAPKTEDPVEEKTTEEIDASFTEVTAAEISAEVAEAEAKSGRALARFEIKKSKDNRFVFNLYAPNRVIVATSQIYSSSPSAVNGIKSIMVNAPKAPVEDTTLKTFTALGFPKWEIYTDKGGQYRFRLYAPNGSCIVHSQGYTTKASCKNGIASIAKNAPDAIIDKSYLKKAEK